MQTIHITEHGDGVNIHWTMVMGQRKVLAATISRASAVQPQKPAKRGQNDEDKRKNNR